MNIASFINVGRQRRYISNKSDGTYKTKIHMNIKLHNFSKCNVTHNKVSPTHTSKFHSNLLRGIYLRAFWRTAKSSLNGKEQPWKSMKFFPTVSLFRYLFTAFSNWYHKIILDGKAEKKLLVVLWWAFTAYSISLFSLTLLLFGLWNGSGVWSKMADYILSTVKSISLFNSSKK